MLRKVAEDQAELTARQAELAAQRWVPFGGGGGGGGATLIIHCPCPHTWRSLLSLMLTWPCREAVAAAAEEASIRDAANNAISKWVPAGTWVWKARPPTQGQGGDSLADLPAVLCLGLCCGATAA